jgi:hypothetical protein
LGLFLENLAAAPRGQCRTPRSTRASI